MSNWAALIDVLSVAGSRLSDGEPNASGTVWFFQPDTNTPVNVYSDAAASAIVTAPVTLTEGGLVSDADYPDGIFVTQPIRLLIQDVDGETVSDFTYIPATAGNVGLNNEGWTGTTVDEAFTALYTSTGGVDGTYLESGGGTERTIQEKFAEIWISVKDFGAAGDGIAIDTTAIQNAMNRVKALGGGVVYFPPGTYKVDQALALTNADGVSIVGTGASAISQTNATAHGFRFDGCDGLRFQGIEVTSTGSSGTAFSLDTCTDVALINSSCGNLSIGGSFLIGLSALDCTRLYSSGCTYASTGGSNIGIYLDGTTRFAFFGGEVGSSAGTTLAFTNAADSGSFHGVLLANISFPATYSGQGLISFYGCTGSISVATATIPPYRVFGNFSVLSSTTSSATGAAQTPSLIAGSEVILIAASGGAGTVTVNSPSVLPGTVAGLDVNLYWDFVFKNAAGGAVTWTLNAVYDVASSIPNTDAHTICVRFRWDLSTSTLREVSRSDTTT